MSENRTRLHVARLDFRLGERLADMLAGRYLGRRARRNLGQGYPQLAVFAFDYIGQEVNLLGRFERDELAALFDFLAPLGAEFEQGTALDVGANIGNHSLFFSARFAAVHAFEPNPRTFRLLEVNAGLTGNVTPHNIGLGAEKGRLELTVDPLNVGEASLVSGGQGGSGDPSRRQLVTIERLDDVASDWGRISFLKVDVEGFEAEVFRGARDLLRRDRPIIAFEQNLAAFAGGASEAVEVLRELDYSFCVMRKRHSGGSRMLRPFQLALKTFGGLRYEIEKVDRIAPDTYPMLLAIDPPLLQRLSR